MDEQQEFKVPKDQGTIAFGAHDGTTHRLEPDKGAITVDNAEDAAHLESLGFKAAKSSKPAAPALATGDVASEEG